MDLFAHLSSQVIAAANVVDSRHIYPFRFMGQELLRRKTRAVVVTRQVASDDSIRRVAVSSPVARGATVNPLSGNLRVRRLKLVPNCGDQQRKRGGGRRRGGGVGGGGGKRGEGKKRRKSGEKIRGTGVATRVLRSYLSMI